MPIADLLEAVKVEPVVVDEVSMTEEVSIIQMSDGEAQTLGSRGPRLALCLTEAQLEVHDPTSDA